MFPSPNFWRRILLVGDTTSCGGQSRGPSKVMTQPTRAAPALWHFATNGRPGTTVRTGGSRKATASSSSISHPNAASTERHSISARR